MGEWVFKTLLSTNLQADQIHYWTLSINLHIIAKDGDSHKVEFQKHFHKPFYNKLELT